MDKYGRYEHYPDLITLGAMTVAGGQVYGGLSANQAGQSGQAMAKYNARLDMAEAKQVEATTALKQDREAEAADRYASSLAAEAGMSGAVTSVGSPLLIAAKQASEAELDQLMIGYEGQTQQQQLRSKAAMDRMEGEDIAGEGRDKMYGSFLSAGGTLLQGFARVKKPQVGVTGGGYGQGTPAWGT